MEKQTTLTFHNMLQFLLMTTTGCLTIIFTLFMIYCFIFEGGL